MAPFDIWVIKFAGKGSRWRTTQLGLNGRHLVRERVAYKRGFRSVLTSGLS